MNTIEEQVQEKIQLPDPETQKQSLEQSTLQSSQEQSQILEKSGPFESIKEKPENPEVKTETPIAKEETLNQTEVVQKKEE